MLKREQTKDSPEIFFSFQIEAIIEMLADSTVGFPKESPRPELAGKWAAFTTKAPPCVFTTFFNPSTTRGKN